MSLLYLSIKTTPEYLMKISDDPNYRFGFFDISGPRHFIIEGNTIFEFDKNILTKADQETINRLQLFTNV